MQRWEVIKGIQEGVFKNGDRFEVTYPDGDMYYAGIDSQGILIWLHNETLVHMFLIMKMIGNLLKIN